MPYSAGDPIVAARKWVAAHTKALRKVEHVDATLIVREVFRDVFGRSDEFMRRSLLRRQEAERRRNPIADAHVRLYLATFTRTERSVWTCPRCGATLPHRLRPRDRDDRAKKHCGCRTGKIGVGRPRKVVREHQIIHNRVSRELWLAMRGKKAGRKWQTILGYSAKDLADHLSKMLPRGYSLKRCIDEGWHIDHIVPKSAFDLSDMDELRAAWSMSNLRLLPAGENIRKSDRREFLV